MNWFKKAATYLYIYTGTLTADEWEKTVKRVYKEHEYKLGTKGAMDQVIEMVAYYCIEIGAIYQGKQATSKFRTCYLWPDFKMSDPWWKEEWKVRKEAETKTIAMRNELAALPSIQPKDIDNNYVSRAALNALLREVNRRHNGSVPETVEPELRILVSIYGGYAVSNIIRSKEIRDRNKIPTLVSGYFIEQELVKKYGNKLKNMKMAEINGE